MMMMTAKDVVALFESDDGEVIASQFLKML